jgi:hypothetical protein
MITLLTLSEVKSNNKKWFSVGNQIFSQDESYEVQDIKGKPYLIRSTYGFSDMFDRPKVLQWAANPIDPVTYEIGSVTDLFKTKRDLIRFLEEE